VLSHVSTAKYKDENEKVTGSDTHTGTESSVSAVMRLETELTKVQRAKTQCIQALNKVLQTKEKTTATDSGGLVTPLSHLSYEQLLKLAGEDEL
jgi:hypothetical protein